MTRLSEYFLPTEREPPADAEAISHKLMVRAGLIRQVGSGLWSWLPAGWRMHQRIVQIVREEMNAIGGQELLMPVLHPAEPWRRTGRYGIDELFKLKDRRGADMVLAMTHEEIVTGHVAAAVRSYRDLPLILYHFQVKERDEPRPRAGVLRTREFIMKDSYTFDRDREGLDVAYDKHVVAYDRMFDRLGLEWYRVEADVGMMGGTGAHEYMAPCAAGENDVALAGGYAANLEVASADAQAVELPAALDAPEEVQTPGMTTIDAVAQELQVGAGALLKAFPVIVDGDAMKVVVVRGDHRVNEVKLALALGGEFRPAHPDEVSSRLGPPGFIGPVGTDLPILLDEAVAPGGYVAGANKLDAAPPRSRAGPRLPVRFGRRQDRGRRRHGRRGHRPDRAGDRGREHLQARHPVLRAAGRQVPRRVRQGAADLDGVLRLRAGAVGGRRGRAVRRRARDLLASVDGAVRRRGRDAGHSPEARSASCRIASTRELQELGLQTLYDDRDAGPGEKFADAELLGCPLRITVGRRTLAAGELEVQVRRGMEKRSVPIEGAAQAIEALWRELP